MSSGGFDELRCRWLPVDSGEFRWVMMVSRVQMGYMMVMTSSRGFQWVVMGYAVLEKG